MSCCCPKIFVGCFVSCVDFFTITGLIATQTGNHVLEYEMNGQTFTQNFSATATQEFVIPNIFNELGVSAFKITNPDGSAFTYTGIFPCNVAVVDACLFEIKTTIDGDAAILSGDIDLTPSFLIDASTFNAAQSREGVFSIQNIGADESCENIVLEITLPDVLVFTTSVDPLATVTTVLGGFPVQNPSFNYQVVGNKLICTSNAGVTILPAGTLSIMLNFTAIGAPTETGQAIGLINVALPCNNRNDNDSAQGNFSINI